MSIKVLVTGADSQLGKTLKEIVPEGFDLDFKSRKNLDITDIDTVHGLLADNKYQYCYNFAAYTNVNQAEVDKEDCYNINVRGVANLVAACQKNNCTLVHISTDYVYDGEKTNPYTETDATNPLNYYGESKLLGEEMIRNNLAHHIIIRTSWLYSEYNHNFVKTILQLTKKNETLHLVNDQKGTPTYARDLVDFIIHLSRIIKQKKDDFYFGLYHFSNEGTATWFDFGKEIVKLSKQNTKVEATDSSRFVSPAKRPAYSVLSKQKTVDMFGLEVRDWQTALLDFFNHYSSEK